MLYTHADAWKIVLGETIKTPGIKKEKILTSAHMLQLQDEQQQ